MTSTNNQQAHKKETLPRSEAKACLNELIQECSDFQQNLNLIVAIADTADNNAALIEKQSEILDLPSGQDFYNALKSKTYEPSSSLIGITRRTKKRLIGLKDKEQYDAALLLNIQNIAATESLKAEFYALFWKTLSLIDDERRDIAECFERTNDMIAPKWNTPQTASRNMLGDVFAGALLELKGQKGALKGITKKRSKACFEELISHDAQANPLPIMLETAAMVFDDFSKIENNKSAIEKSLNIVSEIIETTDENMIRQWQVFIESAQEMAWSGLSVSQILGAAIYTSDNVYNRTAAYMIADTLNTDPTPIINLDGYNAFADIESQQRSHKIACLDTIEYLTQRQRDKKTAKPFLDMALQSCEMLLDGKPSGFCAPALIAVGLNVMKTADISKKEIEIIFSHEINALPWSIIRNAHKEIINLKKQSKDNNLKTIVEILRQEEDMRESAILIKQLIDMQPENQA